MKIIVIAVLCCLCSACGDGWSNYKCYEAVKKNYPGADVAPIQGNKYKFLVKQPDGEVIYVETMGDDTRITMAYPVFRAK